MTFSDLPEQFIHTRTYRWVVFRCYFYPDKINKIPYHPRGYKASIDNKETWSNFESCMKAIQFGIGHLPGYAITKESHVGCVDLDHCILEDGSFTSTAVKYMERFKDHAYMEKSVSGKGIHIFFWYTGKDCPPTHPEPGVEVYTDGRFIAITGDVIG